MNEVFYVVCFEQYSFTLLISMTQPVMSQRHFETGTSAKGAVENYKL
jgi:hypothetical protein